MTKRILAVLIAAALGLCMFTACGKKDDTQSDTQTQQTDTQDEEKTAEQKEEGTQQEADAKSEATNKEEAPSEPIEMTTEEFEDLVDTFNNPQSDAEKEEARLKLEAVLKQMEQQQQ